MKFTGVLLRPLEQQGDLDGLKIDPAGVRFDADEEVPIWREFNYNVPQDVLGLGHVSRAEDGSLVVSGELNFDLPPIKLAIGIKAEEIEKPGTCLECDLIAVALTANHQDPDQPFITVERP